MHPLGNNPRKTSFSVLHVSRVPLGDFDLRFFDLPLKLLILILDKSEQALSGDSIQIKNNNKQQVSPVIDIHIFQCAVYYKS
jgi:hypothetical protein